MNILTAALLFFLAWWFAEQGLYFFSLVFIIVLVMMALASGNKAPQAPAGAAAAGYGTAASTQVNKQWDNRQLEDFGRNLARVVEIPLRIVWGIVRWLWNRK